MKQLVVPAIALACAVVPGIAVAESYSCTGSGPEWLLDFDEVQARLIFPSRTDMDVMLTTPAEGQDWPRAFTLIGDRDTAIILLEQEICGSDLPYRSHILTQRGEAPILLTGCCTVSE